MGPDVVTAVATVAAVVVAAAGVIVASWAAVHSAREQRRIAHEEFLWRARYDLYLPVLAYLDDRVADVEKLRVVVAEHQNRAAQSDLRRIIQEMLDALSELRAAQGLAPRSARVESEAPPDERLTFDQILTKYTEILELPPHLARGVNLVGSKAVRQAVDGYAAEAAFDQMIGDEDLEAWIEAIEFSRSALDRLTAVLSSELRLDSSAS